MQALHTAIRSHAYVIKAHQVERRRVYTALRNAEMWAVLEIFLTAGEIN